MRWTPGTSSNDIEDRRGMSFGGGGRMGGLGLGGLLIVGILSFVFKTDFFQLFNGGGSAGAPTTASAPVATTPEENTRYEFVKFVLNDTQDTWTTLLPKETGVPYQRATLVLFRDEVQSACGTADAASGPFYCPGDHKVYIDLSFYDELKTRFGASGDFAQAYVVAHEVGHHVQSLLGIDDEVRREQRAQPASAKALSVQLELQADCLAGVWGHSTQERHLLESGDVESGLNAASAVGDDHIQKMQGQRVAPDSFTHGSSAQRVAAFRTGFDAGTLASCHATRVTRP
jgi:predicted metalloprotease